MMESKLLIGGKSIVDKTSEQERALEQRRQEIAEQKVTWGRGDRKKHDQAHKYASAAVNTLFFCCMCARLK